jgi:hypothetical protein
VRGGPLVFKLVSLAQDGMFDCPIDVASSMGVKKSDA